ncbi:hypothetical protein CFREI_01785 [Corynebacterium freiburgense]|nr:hypothetical protein CFREI_01785 [Corynebacterium freiburgense]
MKIFSRVVGLYTVFLLSTSVMGASPAFATPDVVTKDGATVGGNSSAQEVDTIVDLKKMSGVSGSVETKGHIQADDQAGMAFSIESKQPEGVLGNVAVPLADGKWAVPENLPTGPDKPVDNAAVDDAIARARTFVAAGRDLRWDSHGLTPLHTSGVVHEKSNKPYPIYCSSLVGMVLKGWDYEHTTYVADANTSVGTSVDLGEAANITDVQDDMWQSNKLARWFYTHGDLWLNNGEQKYERGDLLFLAKQKPEGSDANTGEYFGNIYHVAMYIGDNKVIHSYAPDTDGGVVEQEMDEFLREGTAFVARPDWQRAGSAGKSAPAKSDTKESRNDNGNGNAGKETKVEPQQEGQLSN